MTSSKKKTGKFIVLDGTDGSGKATQTELLKKRIQEAGLQVELADFPRYGEASAKMVEEYLNGTYGTAEEVGPYRASILYACDRYAASFQIREWLNAGKIVISNRYTSSNMGHQAGKIENLKERDIYLEWLKNLEFEIFRIPQPDLTILLYLDPKIGQSWVDKKAERSYIRGKKRDIHEEDLNHLTKAADAYLYVAKKYNWPVINANQTIEDVHQDVWNSVTTELKEYL